MRGGDFLTNHQLTFLHILLLTSSHSLTWWKTENLYLIQLINAWKRENPPTPPPSKLLHTLSPIQHYRVCICVKYCEKKKQTPKVHLDFKCYFPDKWYLCLFERCTFSVSQILHNLLFAVCIPNMPLYNLSLHSQQTHQKFTVSLGSAED